MKQFKIKHTKYIIPQEYKSTPEYKSALSSCKLSYSKTLNFSNLYYKSGYRKFKWLPRLPKNLEVLICQENELTCLPPLPKTLKRLYCSCNFLNNLPRLPNSLRELYCGSNKLTSLPTLPNSLRELHCGENYRLNKLERLPNNLQKLWCNSISLRSLPELPNSLKLLATIDSKYLILTDLQKQFIIDNKISSC